MKTKREDVRNVAIIAHVDHGKTTLVDELLKQSGVFRENQEVEERVMDSNDIERERGITILSKNTAVHYNGVKINIIDTPGHADFGGEVERVLKMVNGVVLVVDAFEGAMPQTKFVLRKALELELPVIVCINKIDRPEARPDDVIDEVLELFIDLGASDEQLECPFVYASAKAGVAVLDLSDEKQDMKPLFETILDYIPAPEGDPEAPTQMLISTIDYNEYVGRIGVGKVENGTISVNQDMVVVNHHDPDKQKKVKISKLYEFDGLQKVEVKEASIGAIVAISGISDIAIGDTLCSPENRSLSAAPARCSTAISPERTKLSTQTARKRLPLAMPYSGMPKARCPKRYSTLTSRANPLFSAWVAVVGSSPWNCGSSRKAISPISVCGLNTSPPSPRAT